MFISVIELSKYENKKLEILCLIENPISKQPNYRKKVLEILPFLKKLDDLENTDFEEQREYGKQEEYKKKSILSTFFSKKDKNC